MFSRWLSPHRRDFASLGEAEILSLAIGAEEEDAAIYQALADRLAPDFPGTAELLRAMAAQEDAHRRALLDLYRTRIGERLVPIRRQDVRGFPARKPIWLLDRLSVEQVRQLVFEMEASAQSFYRAAALRAFDVPVRKLLGDLAKAEAEHGHFAASTADASVPAATASAESREQNRQFILTYVQPGLAGLMDGSVSTLAPVFAAAFATQDTWATFLVGLAAAVGAGISMGFTEAAADDGKLSGRGSPITRGVVTGLMTTLGGLGHALPYLIPHFWAATGTAAAVVLVELWAIAFIQNRYMSTPFWRAALQVVVGGALVFGAGILIGSA